MSIEPKGELPDEAAERAKFETWTATEPLGFKFSLAPYAVRCDGQYATPRTEFAWMGWQARASIAAAPAEPPVPAAWMVTRLKRKNDVASGRVRYLHLDETLARDDFEAWVDIEGASTTLVPLYASPVGAAAPAEPRDSRLLIAAKRVAMSNGVDFAFSDNLAALRVVIELEEHPDRNEHPDDAPFPTAPREQKPSRIADQQALLDIAKEIRDWGSIGLFGAAARLEAIATHDTAEPASHVWLKAQSDAAEKQHGRTLLCGHHASLMLTSAETGEPLYCELCNAQSARRDAEQMESELRAVLAGPRYRFWIGDGEAAMVPDANGKWLKIEQWLAVKTDSDLPPLPPHDQEASNGYRYWCERKMVDFALRARGIEPEGRESEGPRPKADEPGPVGTRPEAGAEAPVQPSPAEPTSVHNEAKWRIRLSCCGRDDGVLYARTWAEADQMRNDYTSGLGVHPNGYSAPPHESGHKRSAIIEEVKPAEPPLWQYRWLNPGNDGNVGPSMLEWKEVAPSTRIQSLEERIEELRAFRYKGKPAYEVRALYAAQPVQPSGSDDRKNAERMLEAAIKAVAPIVARERANERTPNQMTLALELVNAKVEVERLRAALSTASEGAPKP